MPQPSRPNFCHHSSQKQTFATSLCVRILYAKFITYLSVNFMVSKTATWVNSPVISMVVLRQAVCCSIIGRLCWDLKRVVCVVLHLIPTALPRVFICFHFQWLAKISYILHSSNTKLRWFVLSSCFSVCVDKL